MSAAPAESGAVQQRTFTNGRSTVVAEPAADGSWRVMFRSSMGREVANRFPSTEALESWVESGEGRKLGYREILTTRVVDAEMRPPQLTEGQFAWMLTEVMRFNADYVGEIDPADAAYAYAFELRFSISPTVWRALLAARGLISQLEPPIREDVVAAALAELEAECENESVPMEGAVSFVDAAVARSERLRREAEAMAAQMKPREVMPGA